MLSACTDDSISTPDDSSADPRISFAYRVDNYGQGMSRADGAYCWQDQGWNEIQVLSLDLFLIKDGIITAHMQNRELIKTADCLTHTFVNYADLPDGFSINKIKESDHIALVANYRPFLDGNNVGKDFMTVYKNHTILKIDSRQEGFVMVGYIPTPISIQSPQSKSLSNASPPKSVCRSKACQGQCSTPPHSAAPSAATSPKLR